MGKQEIKDLFSLTDLFAAMQGSKQTSKQAIDEYRQMQMKHVDANK